MRTSIVVAAFLVTSASGFGQDADKDLEKFQGRWSVLRSERDGKPDPAQVRETFRVTIRGRGLLMTGSDGEVIQEEASLSLDPSRTPKAIDVRDDLTKKVNQGIYLLADDRLTICIDRGNKGRPKEFSSKDGRSLLVLQRAKQPVKPGGNDPPKKAPVPKTSPDTIAAPPDDAEVARLVKQLGSSDFRTREAARKELEAIGEPARAALRNAAASGADLEMKRRASALMQTLNAKLQILCYDLHSEAVLGVAFSPDGRRVISASHDGTVRLFEASTGKLIHCLAHPNAYSVAFSPDGKKAISTGEGDNHTLRLWDLETGKELQRFAGYRAQAEAGAGWRDFGAAFSPDGKHVLFCVHVPYGGTLRLLDIESGQETKRWAAKTGNISAIALSADGKKSLSGSFDTTVRLWDNATGKELKRFDGHKDRVYAVAFSKDGKRAVSGGLDRVIKLWDLETGKEIRQMEPHAFPVHGLAFSRDGRRIASANYDNERPWVSLWDTETGKELHRFEGHTASVYDVAFSADGRFLVSGGNDKSVRVWRVPQ